MKKIFTGSEIGDMYTHWPYLDIEKLNKITRRQTRKYKLKTLYGHETHEIYDTNPILVTPFKDNYMVLNGKHRCYLSYLNSYNLLTHIAHNSHELEHKISKKALGNTNIEFLIHLIEQPAFFHGQAKKKRIRDFEVNFCRLN
jgi:hypothetical protein